MPTRHHLLGEVTLVHQSLVAHRHLNRIEILPLDVLHDGHLKHSLIVRGADVGRDDVHSSPLAGLEPALAADDLIASVLEFAHRDRLDETECPDRVGQFLQRLVVERHTRLVRVRLNQIHRDPEHVTVVLLGF